jgi:predicted DNA-binding transcriptional regulator AlpA
MAFIRVVLKAAPPDGITIREIVAVTGMSRPWAYYRLTELAASGRAVRTGRARWGTTQQVGRP